MDNFKNKNDYNKRQLMYQQLSSVDDADFIEAVDAAINHRTVQSQRKQKRLTYRLQYNDYIELCLYAKALNVTTSEAIRRLISQAFDAKLDEPSFREFIMSEANARRVHQGLTPEMDAGVKHHTNKPEQQSPADPFQSRFKPLL